MRKKVTFVEWAGCYIAERRVLGFGMRHADKQLLSFAQFADRGLPGGPLTIELIVAWARASRRSSALTWGRRLEVVRLRSPTKPPTQSDRMRSMIPKEADHL